MICAEMVDPAATADPTVIAALFGVGGVILTLLAGGLGALFQARREHRRWVRERRLEAYLNFMEHAHAIADEQEALDSIAESLATLKKDVETEKSAMAGSASEREGAAQNFRPVTSKIQGLMDELSLSKDRLHALMAGLAGRVAPLSLLGPSGVREAALPFHEGEGLEREERDAAIVTLQRAMREAIGITD